jgi:hypothetical protein
MKPKCIERPKPNPNLIESLELVQKTRKLALISGICWELRECLRIVRNISVQELNLVSYHLATNPHPAFIFLLKSYKFGTNLD